MRLRWTAGWRISGSFALPIRPADMHDVRKTATVWMIGSIAVRNMH